MSGFILPMHVTVRCSLAVFALALLAVSSSEVTGQTQASASLVLGATVRSRTSLQVSTAELRFDVPNDLVPPTVVVDFRAAARARKDGDVVLTVQPLAPIHAGSRDAGPGLVVSFEGDGARYATLSGPEVVGAWKGSGVRAGHVSFTLHGASAAGTYVLSVRFTLSVS